MINSCQILCDFTYKEYIDVEYAMDTALSKTNELTVVDKFKHHFNPQGISLIYILAESHISIHTWEEYNFISVDMYTCGTKSPKNTLNAFLNFYNILDINKQEIKRGI